MTAVDFATLLGVSEKTVRNWMNKNGLPFTELPKGRVIESVAALEWWHAYRASLDGNDGNSASPQGIVVAESYEDALARKTRADADLQELRLAKARGEVAAVADVERALSSANMAAQTQILAVPSRLATRLLGLEDHGTVVRILESEMRQLLTNLADFDALRDSVGLEVDGE